MDVFTEALCQKYEQELGIPDRILCSIVESSNHDGSIVGLSPELAASFGVGSDRADAIRAAGHWVRYCIDVCGPNEFALIGFYQGLPEALRKARVTFH
ncbi:hypothetical protein [Methylocaldum gracile]|jgi:hypothetical protein|uniref:hypothetical protein n=1 Tax=Methylocaldum sp. 0917 TaxID=2485163 RepID=UPI0010603684